MGATTVTTGGVAGKRFGARMGAPGGAVRDAWRVFLAGEGDLLVEERWGAGAVKEAEKSAPWPRSTSPWTDWASRGGRPSRNAGATAQPRCHLRSWTLL